MEPNISCLLGDVVEIEYTVRDRRQDPGERKLEKSTCCQVVFHPVVTLGGSKFYLFSFVVFFFFFPPNPSLFLLIFFYCLPTPTATPATALLGEIGLLLCEVSVCVCGPESPPRLRRHSKFLFKRTAKRLSRRTVQG